MAESPLAAWGGPDVNNCTEMCQTYIIPLSPCPEEAIYKLPVHSKGLH